jgi:hypothetical protein
MNLTVKTLKGGKFTVEVEPTNTVAEVKTAIVSYRIIFFLRLGSSQFECGLFYLMRSYAMQYLSAITNS